MDLFEYQAQQHMKQNAPLAARMRPRTLDEFVGQTHIVGANTLLRRAITADRLSSVILYGPPGTGKTTLGRIVANTTKNAFMQLNATTSGVKDIKATVEEARNLLGRERRRTIVYIDEIHRFNKSQQDALLPHVEDGTLILMGATTENPYFEVNNALLSRSIVFEFSRLSQSDIEKLLRRALTDTERGLGNMKIEIEDEAVSFLADMADGDARSALNAIELAAQTTEPTTDGIIHIDMAVAQECIQRRALGYDRDGDNHYDTISAFIKSMRGSDPDAAVYYLARMIHAGEDPRFIARRIVICAAEDVSLADPHALLVAQAAADAVNFIGMPEGRIILAEAAIYVACAPKSNSASTAIDNALEYVRTRYISGVPRHLKDASYANAGKLGNGIGYKYAHLYPGHYVKQQYLPDELVGTVFYEPSQNGIEKRISEYLEKIKQWQ